MYESIHLSSRETHNIDHQKIKPKFLTSYNNRIPILGIPQFEQVKTINLKNTHQHPSGFDNKNKIITMLVKEMAKTATNISILDLSHHKIGYFPLEIFHIPQLLILKFGYNKVQSIPVQIEQLSSLELLHLNHNSIKFLPSALFRLNNLKELSLEANLIDQIPDELGNLKQLQILNLMRNKFENIPLSFGKLDSLIELKLEWFQYTDPKLNVHQKGPGGACNIQKLREKCIKLQKEAIPLSLERFLNFFSFTIRNMYTRDERGRSLLHEACLNEDISIIKYIINQAPELVDSGDHKEMTPLCISLAESKHLSVQYLLKYGACVKEGGGFLGSPLHIAIRNLNQSAVQKILE